MIGQGINRLVDARQPIISGKDCQPVNPAEAATLNRDAARVFGVNFEVLSEEQQKQIFLGWFDIPGQRTT